MTPTLSIVTPTQGRPTLERMIASGRDQLLPGDEWLVVIDAHEMAREAVYAVARRVGAACPQCRALSLDVGYHDHGHSQINHGMEEARGDWLVHMDDDDVFTVGALDAIRRAIAALDGPRPLLFRFEAPFGRRPLIWQRAGVLAPGTVGGHCLVHPNIAGAIGHFTSRYEGDYDCIRETLDLWGGRVEWVDAVIARCRPQGKEVAA
jgi:glycosyltransferase involved in cell wall biosynthesis